jgi:hypothetical protein
MMKKYRLKSLEMGALFFDGSVESANKIQKWSQDKTFVFKKLIEIVYKSHNENLESKKPQLEILNEEGRLVLIINPGEWVIKGSRGQFFIHDDETFKEEFEEITD